MASIISLLMRPYSEVPLISKLNIFFSFIFFGSSFAMQDSGMKPSWLMLGYIVGGNDVYDVLLNPGLFLWCCPFLRQTQTSC